MDIIDDLAYRTPRPGQRRALERFVDRCSDTAIYRRFHSGGRGLTLAREIDRWLDGPPNYITVVAVETGASSSVDGPVHGVANLALSSDGTAEIAVLVEDRWRRRGVATRLMWSLAGRATEHGLSDVVVDIQPDNRPAIDLLNALTTGYRVLSDGADLRAAVPIPRRETEISPPRRGASAPEPIRAPSPA